MATQRFDSGRLSPDEEESAQLLPGITSPSRHKQQQPLSTANTTATATATYLFLYVFLLLLLLCAAVLYLLSSDTAAVEPTLVEDVSTASQWVSQYRVESLFGWTWLHNGDYQRYLQHLAALPSPPPAASASPVIVDEPTVVNDPVAYFASHPNEGLVVDYVRQLPNPSPHPLPNALDWLSTCQSLNIGREWAMCRLHPDVLNDWLPATTHVMTVALYDAYVDPGNCSEEVPGTPFTVSATYHFQRWTNQDCYNSAVKAVQYQPVRHYTELIDTLGTYWNAMGHFAPQQLPRIIRSLAVAPVTAKVLVARGGIADTLMDVLVERRVVTRDRIVQYQGGTYSADVLYRTDTWPYLTDKYNHYAHDRTDMQLVHRSLVDDLPDHQRDLIVVIKRDGSQAWCLAFDSLCCCPFSLTRIKTRDIEQHDELVAYITEQLNTPAASALRLHVAVFEGNGHVRDHIALFQRAKVMIGAHGAGMLNLYWLKPGSVVVEVGYDEGMTYPEMYAEMALHSDHSYYVAKGKGSYDGSITLDWDDWQWAWHDIVNRLHAAAAKQPTAVPAGNRQVND